jgi:hypothetical protein
MALQLPTDTQHLALDTRQYELFNRPLGQGISRRRIYLAALVCLLWWVPLAVLGVNPLTRLGPTLFLVPPFVVVYFGTRTGDDGRLALMRWYDAVLAITPARRRVIHNPLLPAAASTPATVRLDHLIVEIHPDIMMLGPADAEPAQRVSHDGTHSDRSRRSRTRTTRGAR